MAFFAKDPRQQMLLGGGERVSGAEVREQSKFYWFKYNYDWVK